MPQAAASAYKGIIGRNITSATNLRVINNNGTRIIQGNLSNSVIKQETQNNNIKIFEVENQSKPFNRLRNV